MKLTKLILSSLATIALSIIGNGIYDLHTSFFSEHKKITFEIPAESVNAIFWVITILILCLYFYTDYNNKQQY